jgi:REP element-mobilizing transposase RayT
MFREIRKVSISRDKIYKGAHRFEHWYLDNCTYFITARCRDRTLAFQSEEAKAIFWDRFEHYAAEFGFVPWATSLIANHYHTIGYLKVGENLGPMMQRFHGSVAKLVNDVLPKRLKPFWCDSGKQGYFDGCIRDEKQARRAYAVHPAPGCAAQAGKGR